MLPLCFETQRFPSSSRAQTKLSCLVALLAAFGAVGCSSDDGDGGGEGTVALADSASLQELTRGEIGIPTTVAVTQGWAWVVESQFDRYAPFGGTEAPSPFRLIGVSLADGAYDEIPLPNGFFPEGIAATPGGRLYVGSFATGSIVTIAPNTAVPVDFVTSLAPSTIGIRIDNDNRTLWACNSDTAATPPTARVLGIDIGTGQTIATHTLEPSDAGSFCNDIVQSPDNALWVTESFGGRIFRIDGGDLTRDESAEVWLEADELAPPNPGQFGVNGITLLDGQLFVVVTDEPGKLYSIDPTLEAPTGSDLRPITLTEGDDTVDLVRPDGLATVPDSTDLLIVENGLQVDGGKKLLRAHIQPR